MVAGWLARLRHGDDSMKDLIGLEAQVQSLKATVEMQQEALEYAEKREAELLLRIQEFEQRKDPGAEIELAVAWLRDTYPRIAQPAATHLMEFANKLK
jgi:hypothetical protein